MLNRKKIAPYCLLLSVFFLPFGYDALFKLIMELTGSYWIADIIFYCISFVFFMLYLFLSKINIFNHFNEKAKIFRKKLQNILIIIKWLS